MSSLIDFRRKAMYGLKKPVEIHVFCEESTCLRFLEDNGFQFKTLREVLVEIGIDKSLWNYEVNKPHLSRKICINAPLIMNPSLKERLGGEVVEYDDLFTWLKEICNNSIIMQKREKEYQLVKTNGLGADQVGMIKRYKKDYKLCYPYYIRPFHAVCCAFSPGCIAEKALVNLVKLGKIY